MKQPQHGLMNRRFAAASLRTGRRPGKFAKLAAKDVVASFMNGCGIQRSHDCWATTLAFGEAITSGSMVSTKTLRVGAGKTTIWAGDCGELGFGCDQFWLGPLRFTCGIP